LYIFGVKQTQSIVHDWIHKADLHLKEDHSPDHVAVDKTVIRVDDEKYWLYIAADPVVNELRYTTLVLTRMNTIAHLLLHELREKYGVDHAVVRVDSATPLNEACRRHGLDFKYEYYNDRSSIKVSSTKQNAELLNSLTILVMPKRKPQIKWLRSFAFT
jgi:transposase-like protein